MVLEDVSVEMTILEVLKLLVKHVRQFIEIRFQMDQEVVNVKLVLWEIFKMDV